MFAYLAGALRDEGAIVRIVGGHVDHVHALFSIRPSTLLADLVRDVKANSSKWCNSRVSSHAKFAWQRGYSAFSVSHSQIESVREYIANQATHHARMSFEDELRALLRKHGVELDEEHLLG